MRPQQARADAIAAGKNRALPSSVTIIFQSMNPQETQTETKKTAPEYSVKACAPGDLSDTELATCVEIVKDGGAVAMTLEKLQKARMLAVARKAGTIVGVGSIKRDRPDR